MYIGPARSKNDFESAQQLAAETFGEISSLTIHESLQNKEILW